MLEIELGPTGQQCSIKENGNPMPGVYKIVVVAEMNKATKLKIYRYLREEGSKVVIRGILADG